MTHLESWAAGQSGTEGARAGGVGLGLGLPLGRAGVHTKGPRSTPAGRG
jgi:hypothetical protein